MGLTLVPWVAWAMGFTPLYLISHTARFNWLQTGFLPSVGEAIVVAVTCVIIYFIYQSYLDFTS